MKTRTEFICEICGTSYKDVTLATKCENGHVKPVEIDNAEYNFAYDHPRGKYPEFIPKDLPGRWTS